MQSVKIEYPETMIFLELFRLGVERARDIGSISLHKDGKRMLEEFEDAIKRSNEEDEAKKRNAKTGL